MARHDFNPLGRCVHCGICLTDDHSGYTCRTWLQKQLREARRMLGECYVESGADTDGNKPGSGHLWPTAVQEVAQLRKDYDEGLEEDAENERRLAAALSVLQDVEWACRSRGMARSRRERARSREQFCPSCRRRRVDGHEADCALSAVLEGK